MLQYTFQLSIVLLYKPPDPHGCVLLIVAKESTESVWYSSDSAVRRQLHQSGPVRERLDADGTTRKPAPAL